MALTISSVSIATTISIVLEMSETLSDAEDVARVDFMITGMTPIIQ